ncbi:MAG TPA: hypothetical protein VM535_00805 [Candidatus Saccharimonadales bacterium]|nr:hypothetical protein [Candidatus Saccharimonadales bacterium]
MSEYNIAHLAVDSPFGNAGGVVKRPEDVEKMAHSGVGWIEAGSYTMEPRAGNGPNGEVVYYHDPATGETFNSLGMPNKGMDVVETEIPVMAETAHGFGKPLLVNVAPVSDDPAAESRELVRRAYEAGADAVLLNAGCPNVVTADGQRHEILGKNQRALNETLLALRPVTEKFTPVFVRLSPLDSRDESLEILRAVECSGGAVSAIFTPNTWPGHKPVDAAGQPILEVPGGTGGKSGPATAKDAARQTAWLALSTLMPVVSSGGIMNGQELAKRMYHRSSAVGHIAVGGAGTTFFYESQDWEYAVDKLLWEFQDSR